MKNNTRSAAFTLIELLTVIAIIGILAAILIPVVGAVRENARQTKCMSNLRQVALAVLTYESEIGHLPGPSFRRVRRPFGDVPDYREINWTLDSYIGGRRSEVWDCPSNAMQFDEALNPGNVTFVLNNHSQTGPVPPRLFGYPGRDDDEGLPKSLEQIESAGTGPYARMLTELSQIWMISDVDGRNYNSATIGSSGAHQVPLSDSALPVHNGGRNYVFFDGHAEFRQRGDFPPGG